jgi:hypothetical protein
MSVLCPACHFEVEPAPRVKGLKGYLGSPRFCPTPINAIERCGTDLVNHAGLPVPAARVRTHDTEAVVLKRILKYLGSLGQEVRAWRHSVGMAQHNGVMHRYGTPGEADIICCAWGTFLAVEVKSATGRQAPNQRAYEEQVERAMGRYVLARSVDDVRIVIETIRDSRIAEHQRGAR